MYGRTPFERWRSRCQALEQETWEQPTFRVRKRIFVMFSDREREAWVKSTHDEQRALVQMDPETFFVPPYVGPSGWVGVRFRTVDREEMRELVTEAWRLTAPKRSWLRSTGRGRTCC